MRRTVGAAIDFADYKSARALITKLILDRAPPSSVGGGHAALTKENAGRLFYGHPKSDALMHDPLGGVDPAPGVGYRRASLRTRSAPSKNASRRWAAGVLERQPI